MKTIKLLLIATVMFVGTSIQAQESQKITKGMNKVTFKSEGLKIAGNGLAPY
jgi:hypothetical protein